MATQTLQQLRAKHALQKVKDLEAEVTRLVHAKQKSAQDKLKARASELPFMIHTNGLGPALAFFKSKIGKDDSDRYGQLFDVLQSWLTENKPGRPFAGKADLMQAITETDFNRYRLAQAEAIQYMDWVKKFASAYLIKKDAEHE